MLDILNEQLIGRGEEPVAFDSDCREGICGDVQPNDQSRSTRTFPSFRGLSALHAANQGWGNDHDRAFRARSFPIVKDLVINRTALDRIVQAGGFISARTGSTPEANWTPVPKHSADLAMEAAACIGC